MNDRSIDQQPPVFFKNDVFVVIPAYNEGPSIANVLVQLVSRRYNVIVVDDGSRDDTTKEVLRHPVTLLRHICNLGQGAALQTGIAYALTVPQMRYVVTFDADGQHDPDEIPSIVNPLRKGESDVTLGSRFIKGGQAVGISFQKRATLMLAVAFTRMTSGLVLTDTHNGFRGFSAAAAAKINITHNRMAHASEILNQIAVQKLSYREVPVTIRYTSYSLSKGQSIANGFNIFWEMLTGKMR